MSAREFLLLSLQADQILRFRHPEQLFSGTCEELKDEFKTLASRWHPDRQTGSGEVMAHINGLYLEAETRIADGAWQGRGVTEFTDTLGRLHRLTYLRRVPFELGDSYLGQSYVAYVLKQEHRDFAAQAINVIPSFSFADEAMRKTIQPSLPVLRDSFTDREDQTVLVLEKPQEMVRLRDLLDHMAVYGTVPEWPRHVAWILNSLYNLCCYFAYTGLCHHDLSPDSYFLSPGQHNGLLLGGWWYSEPQGSVLRGVSARTFDQMPPDLLAERRADIRTDLELIRFTGRELLGDLRGMGRSSHDTAPPPLMDWLRSSSGGDPFDDYRNFQSCLHASFGARKFVSLSLTAEEIYR